MQQGPRAEQATKEANEVAKVAEEANESTEREAHGTEEARGVVHV